MSSLDSLTWIPFDGLYNAAMTAKETNALYDRIMEDVMLQETRKDVCMNMYFKKLSEIMKPKLGKSFVGQGLNKPGTIAKVRAPDGKESLYVFGGTVGTTGEGAHDQPSVYAKVIEYAVLF